MPWEKFFSASKEFKIFFRLLILKIKIGRYCYFGTRPNLSRGYAGRQLFQNSSVHSKEHWKCNLRRPLVLERGDWTEVLNQLTEASIRIFEEGFRKVALVRLQLALWKGIVGRIIGGESTYVASRNTWNTSLAQPFLKQQHAQTSKASAWSR